ncbi:globin domain-containing protein [Sphingomonas sp. RS6]
MPVPDDSPYARLGGAPAIRAIVDRFYDLVEGDPRYADLHAMHAGDLSGVRQSLAGFLIAWTGGPRDWFDMRPGMCIMSAHRAMPLTGRTAAQWAHAMDRAIAADPGLEPDAARHMAEALARMCRAMAVQADTMRGQAAAAAAS